MTAGVSLQYHNAPLHILSEQLNEDYYVLIDLLCRHAREHADLLKNKRLTDSSQTYVAKCMQLVEKIQAYTDNRTQSMVPYLHELAEKNSSGHNCSSCSGRCDMQHTARTAEVTASLREIKKSLYDMHTAALLDYNPGNKELRMLHHEMELLENMLNEVFIIEEEHLLPKIKAAQKNINATS